MFGLCDSSVHRFGKWLGSDLYLRWVSDFLHDVVYLVYGKLHNTLLHPFRMPKLLYELMLDVGHDAITKRLRLGRE